MIRHVLTATIGWHYCRRRCWRRPAGRDGHSTRKPSTQGRQGAIRHGEERRCEERRKVPEELYAFNRPPSAEHWTAVRHIADRQFMCARQRPAEKAPQSGIEKSMTSKAQLSKAIVDANAYCDKFDRGSTTGRAWNRAFFTGPPRAERADIQHRPQLRALCATWSRICAEGIVPPSSENTHDRGELGRWRRCSFTLSSAAVSAMTATINAGPAGRERVGEEPRRRRSRSEVSRPPPGVPRR